MGIDYYEARMKVGDLRATFDTLPDVLMALFQQGEFLTSSAWISADSDKWHDAEGVVVGEDERGAVILTDAWVSAPASAVLDRLRLTCAESGALKHGFERLVDSNVQAEIEYAASQRRDPPRPAGRARRILADRSGDAPDVEPEVLKRQREEWEQRRDEWRRRHDEWQEEYVAGVKQRFSSYEYSDYVNDLRTTIHGGEVVDYPTWPLDNVERPEVWEMRSPLDYEELLLDWFVVVAREAADLPISISAIELIDEDFDLLSILKQEYSQRSADRELFSRAPLIVLTEGSSDADAIDAAIDLLRPDIRDFVAFLDYRQDKVAGGAPELVKMVRALSAVGFKGPVLALFDNDTAGNSAIETLRSNKLRPNIRVRRLPDLPLLSAYPTHGPTGMAELNINGSAAAIECYFGQDILSDGSGLIPIQWTGWDKKMRRYNGELVEKRAAQERYWQKVKAAQSSAQPSADWSGMAAIIDTIIRSCDGPQIDDVLGR